MMRQITGEEFGVFFGGIPIKYSITHLAFNPLEKMWFFVCLGQEKTPEWAHVVVIETPSCGPTGSSKLCSEALGVEGLHLLGLKSKLWTLGDTQP